MAVDSQAKRYSMLNFSDGALLPVPAASLADGDRYQLIDLYSGVTLTGRFTTPTTDPDDGVLYWSGGASAMRRSTARQRA